MNAAIEIFRTGRHTAMSGATLEFGDDVLAASAAAYDPALHEAPIVVGHPKTDGPAYGWVASLAAGEGALRATPSQVDPAFAELLRAGRFKKVSASFYTPDSPANPKPGVYYLRHVGFLGAQPPAVKGLRQADFAEGEEGVIEFADAWTMRSVARLFRGLRDYLIGQAGQEQADAILPAYEIEGLAEQAIADAAREQPVTPATAYAEPKESDKVTTVAPGAKSARETELEAQLAASRQETAAFAERQAAADNADDAAFLERLEAEGRLLPAMRPLAAGLLAALSGEAVSFAEGRAAETPRLALRALLSAAPKAVFYGEVAPEAGAVVTLPATATAAEIAAASLAYQERQKVAGNTVTTIEAIKAVTGAQA